MIKLRHQQPSLWHKGLAKDIEDLWEPWMREVDQLLEDTANGLRGLPTPSQESDTRANPDTGRSRAAAIDPETCAELELRHAGTRSTSQLGVSGVHAHRRRESTGCEDTGTTGTSDRTGSDWEAA